jgi:hypothetical protein
MSADLAMQLYVEELQQVHKNYRNINSHTSLAITQTLLPAAPDVLHHQRDYSHTNIQPEILVGIDSVPNYNI